MKGQGRKIDGHMVRGTRINNPIRRITRIRLMDDNVGIEGSDGRALSSSRGR